MYLPTPNSKAFLFRELVEHGLLLGKNSQNWSELDEDDFIFVCWAKRGYVGEEATEHIAYLYLFGTELLLNLTRSKIMGWGNYALLAAEDDYKQDDFVTWYSSHLDDARKILSDQGVKSPKKKAMNNYFEENDIPIHIN